MDGFHRQWITWWGSCQPKWRSTEAWPYPQGDARDKDWSRLNATGPHGLFPLVVSASWWAGCGKYSDAVDDLHWVMEVLLHVNSQSSDPAPESNAASLNHFPGHGERAAGKRKVKPSAKARCSEKHSR
jgi:hypothetical protein